MERVTLPCGCRELRGFPGEQKLVAALTLMAEGLWAELVSTWIPARVPGPRQGLTCFRASAGEPLGSTHREPHNSGKGLHLE